MFRKTVEDLLQTALDERQDLFLIDFSLSGDNAIKIVIDGDNGLDWYQVGLGHAAAPRIAISGVLYTPIR